MSKLDDIIYDMPLVHQFGCPALERSDGGLMSYTCSCGNDTTAKKQLRDFMLDIIGSVDHLQSCKTIQSWKAQTRNIRRWSARRFLR